MFFTNQCKGDRAVQWWKLALLQQIVFGFMNIQMRKTKLSPPFFGRGHYLETTQQCSGAIPVSFACENSWQSLGDHKHCCRSNPGSSHVRDKHLNYSNSWQKYFLQMQNNLRWVSFICKSYGNKTCVRKYKRMSLGLRGNCSSVTLKWEAKTVNQ